MPAALITGAGKGLGRAYAFWFARHGYSVTVNNRVHPGVPSSAAKVVAQIVEAGGSAATDEHAVDDERGSAAMIADAIERFGRLDVLVCNAGIIDFADILDLESGHFKEVMAVNFWGSVYPVMAALPVMHRQGYGRVVMTISTAGLFGQPKSAYYAASRTAIIGFARSIALDLDEKSGICINMISPTGYTGMAAGLHPPSMAQASYMSPDLVAPVVGWLGSEDCQRSGLILHAGCGRVRRVQIVAGPAIDLRPDGFTEWVEELDDMSLAVEEPSAYAAGDVLRAGLGFGSDRPGGTDASQPTVKPVSV